MRILRILFTRAAHISLSFALIAIFLTYMPSARASTSSLTIFEVAGAGGLSGATYRQDTIILFNPTQNLIHCTTCAIQTHSGTSNTSSWTVYKLPSLSIPAGGFYMISASSPTLSTYGDLPSISYDYRLKTIEGTVKDGTSGDNILSSTVGVVALTSTQAALTASSSNSQTLCGTGSQLLDLVGYGSDIATNSSTSPTPATCYAGSGEAYYDGSSTYGRQLGVTRKNKCINSFEPLNPGDHGNVEDFANIPVTYFNSSSPVSLCPTGNQLTATISAAPTNPGVLESVTFKAIVTKATLPASTGISVFLNFDSPYYGGAPLQMYDDGTHGDNVAGDGTYTIATTIPSGVTAGFIYPTNVTVSDAVGNSYIGLTRVNVAVGTIAMTTPNTTGTVASGGVLTFPITIRGQHGYGGLLDITCTGAPNTNSLGVPISTQCVSTPPQVILGTNGTATISLAIATGTTHSASMVLQHSPLKFLSILSIALLTMVTLTRRRNLSSIVLLFFMALSTLNTVGCEANSGLGNTGAAPGTYTYTVTATDTNVSTATNSLIFTVTVQ